MSALEKIRVLASWQGPLDLEDAVDQIEKRIDQLRAALAAAAARADAAEAKLAAKEKYAAGLFDECSDWAAHAGRSDKRVAELEAALAAVPVEALRRWHKHSSVEDHIKCGLYDPADAYSDLCAINDWVAHATAREPEVQP